MFPERACIGKRKRNHIAHKERPGSRLWAFCFTDVHIDEHIRSVDVIKFA
jgi:hypothetical protein